LSNCKPPLSVVRDDGDASFPGVYLGISSGLSTVVTTPELRYEAETTTGALDESRVPSLSISTNENKKNGPIALDGSVRPRRSRNRPESRRKHATTVYCYCCWSLSRQSASRSILKGISPPSVLFLGESSRRPEFNTGDQHDLHLWKQSYAISDRCC